MKRGKSALALILAAIEAAGLFYEILSARNGETSVFNAKYPTQFTPQFESFPTVSDDPGFPPNLASTANAANGQAAQAIGYMQAIHIALNRTQGAFLMGDEASLNLQSQALSTFLNSTGMALSQYASSLQSMSNIVSGSSVDFALSSGDIQQFQMALQAQGFTALPQQEQDLFSTFNVNPGDFALILNDLLGIDPAMAATSWSVALSNLANWASDLATLYAPA